MPRRARIRSSTDIYHVMMRGVNKQKIFHNSVDSRMFLRSLQKYKEKCGYKVYAYCLMPNHIHLLIGAGNEPLDHSIKRLNNSFVFWYNRKYERVGHLFQNRYKSEPVEDDSYFLTALRYIIQNPMKAGLENAPGEYPWSSYSGYAGMCDHITDTEFAAEMFSSQEQLLRFLCRGNKDRCLDLTDPPEGVTDEDAAEIIEAVTGCRSPGDFQQMDRERKEEYIRVLREQKLTCAQISRLTGMPRTSVRRLAGL